MRGHKTFGRGKAGFGLEHLPGERGAGIEGDNCSLVGEMRNPDWKRHCRGAARRGDPEHRAPGTTEAGKLWQGLAAVGEVLVCHLAHPGAVWDSQEGMTEKGGVARSC